MPTARSGCSAASAAGSVHVLGGLGSNGLAVSMVDRWSPETGEWQAGLPLPEPRAGCAVGSAGEMLYIAAGFGNDRLDSDKAEYFDANSGDLFQMPSLPFARRLCCGAVVWR